VTGANLLPGRSLLHGLYPLVLPEPLALDERVTALPWSSL
jgi:hypothetical protein